MSRIKQEIDKALEYYGDQATVFRVVRRALRGWEKNGRYNEMVNQFSHEAIQVCFIMRWIWARRKNYIHHIRRLLPIERPVTTERLKQAMDDR